VSKSTGALDLKTVRRLGLRWLLSAVLTVTSGLLFWYGRVQDEIARALLNGNPWIIDWQSHPMTRFAGGLNLPATIVGVVLKNRVPDRVIEVIFCLFVPVQWWLVGMWADSELGFGRYQGRARPPLSERTLTLTCIVSLVVLTAIATLARGFYPSIGLFWMLLIPMSFLTWVIRWRRLYRPPT